MAKKGEVHWVPKGAFVMPLLPKSLGLDPLLSSLLHTVAFLEFSDDDTVDPDWAVEAMEHVGHYMQQMNSEQIGRVHDQLDRISAHLKKKKQPKQIVDFVATFLHAAGVIDEDDA